jgi:hypothetical protein
MNQVIFLLGAGASVDAGMPTVAQLTKELRCQLPLCRDRNGKQRPDFAQLFNTIAAHDPAIKDNYERFFDWLMLLTRVQMGPFRNAIQIKMEPSLATTAGELAFVIKRPVYEILRAHQSETSYGPGYFAGLGRFLPKRGRLKVFTRNYDLCVEDACRSASIDLTTGFRKDTKRWDSSVFQFQNPGINLYKLHGSLSWVLDKFDNNCPDRSLIEAETDHTVEEPELILGPGPKLQSDEPFLTLYYEFRKALQSAKQCVVVGYSFGDAHINGALREANRLGLTVIDVNPSNEERDWRHYKKLKIKAKEAFEKDDLLAAV